MLGLAVNRQHVYFIDRRSTRYPLGRVPKPNGGRIQPVLEIYQGLSGLVAVDTTATHSELRRYCRTSV